MPRRNITPVAWFEYDFESLISQFKARASTDAYGGGAGRCQWFCLMLRNSRYATICRWDKTPGTIEVSLELRAGGRVDIEDLEQVLEPLCVDFRSVLRQSAFLWKHRRG